MNEAMMISMRGITCVENLRMCAIIDKLCIAIDNTNICVIPPRNL
ncbi:hypothetical protein [Helicobacter typhlonius]